MGLLDLLLVAVGLSMDAFAVSVCKGLNTKMHPVKTGLVAGLYFGGFQALCLRWDISAAEQFASTLKRFPNMLHYFFCA